MWGGRGFLIHKLFKILFHVKQLEVEYIECCPLCRSHTFERVMAGTDYLTLLGEFSIVRCRKCNLLFTNPRPAENSIALCYPGSRYQSHKKLPTSFLDKMYFWVQKLMLQRKRTLIKKLVKVESALLDVGSGVGEFAGFMLEEGFRVSAIEPSGYAREQANEKGLCVFEDIAQYTNSGVEPPHLISLWHVLEHMPNYLENLWRYYEVLRAGGYLVIAVPQFGSLDARFYKSRWAAYDLPRHLFHFSKETLVASAQNAGFAYLKTKGMPFDSFYISLLSEQNSNNSLAFLRAPIIASISNLMALLKLTPWSSQIFVFQKKP